MFHKLMRFGFGGLAIAAALAYVSSASTIAGYQPAFDSVSNINSSGPLTYGYELANATFKVVRDIEARDALNEGAGLGVTTLNRATKPQASIASIRPASVSGWRSGRIRTLAG